MSLPRRQNRSLAGICLVTALLLAAPSPATAQIILGAASTPYVVEQWNVQNGLPQNSVTSLVQTSDGYLWLGTFGGLVRFDGVHFRIFDRLVAGERRANRITALVEGADSTMWVGTESGDVYAYRSGVFTKKLQDAAGLTAGPIITMVRDSTGGIWIGRSSGGLWRVSTTSEGRDSVMPAFMQPMFTAPQISEIVARDVEGIWIGGTNALAQVAGSSLKTISLPKTTVPRVVTHIEIGENGVIWCTTSDQRLFHLSGETVAEVPLTTLSAEYPVADILHGQRPDIRAAAIGGIYRYAEGRFVTSASPFWRTAVIVRHILKDKEGNFWAGSLLDGMLCFRPAPVEMITFPGEQQNVTSMTYEKGRGVWAGLNCGGVRLIRDGVPVDHPLVGIFRNECVWSLLSDRKGHLWGGTWGGGLFRVDPDNVATLTWFTTARGFPSNIILALFEDTDGSIWAGTQDAGVIHIDRSGTKQWSKAQGMPSNDVRAITRDSLGTLWFGTQQGLVRFDNGTLRVFTSRDGLSSEAIRVLAAGRRGALWIGTYGGGLIRHRAGEFKEISTEQGMFDNVISQYVRDADGFAWMGSNRGLWKVQTEELHGLAEGRLTQVASIVYDQNDGLRSLETNGGFQPAGLALPDGDLLFPTGRGIAHVRRERLYSNRVPPPVKIERILADGVDLAVTRRVEIPAGTEEIRIQFTALSFTDPQRVRFKYQLKGYNKNWVETQLQREAVFTNVTPAAYAFRVIAANNEGVWNEEGSEVELVFFAPYWQTWWFRSFAVLALVGMGMLVVAIRLRHVRKEQLRQEETSRRLIEGQEEERQRIAGELHDSLGQDLIVAKNRLLLSLHHLADGSPAKNELMQVVDTITSALKGVRAIAYNLRPFQLDRLGLTETIRSTVRTVQQATSVKIETEIALVDRLVSHEAEIGIFRIIQEGLTNVVKHSGAERASVVVAHDEGWIVIRIQDDGKGFDPIDETHQVSYGFGLSSIEERARLLNGESKVLSTLGSGTTLAVRIPVSGNELKEKE